MLQKIGDFKGIDIEVRKGISDIVYSGLLDEAPVEIKEMNYIRTEPNIKNSKLVFVI
jgi:hypothetical protein